jgi:hypothetical protein
MTGCERNADKTRGPAIIVATDSEISGNTKEENP